MQGRNFDPFNQHPQRPIRPLAGRPIAHDAQNEKIQRKDVMRFLFNPELGSGLQSLNQTHQLFLKLIANLFLQTGLVDATYVGFRDPSRLSLITLVYTAYRGLELTREGIPRVLLFASFVGSMVAVVLSLLILLIGFAQSGGGSHVGDAAAVAPATPVIKP